MNKSDIRRKERLYQEKCNVNNCLMKIVEYNNSADIVVEFQDEYKSHVHTTYHNFIVGCVKNPYYPTVYNVAIIGEKYPSKVNNKQLKEYTVWTGMLKRCFSDKFKKKQHTYTDATCCDEWLNYENFYEWLHSQNNFEKMKNESRWAVDKDIIVKKNKLYSPDTCCIVPQNINCLFLKREASRGDTPLGVRKNGNTYDAYCQDSLTNKGEHLGNYSSAEEAFNAYKQYKENIIKQVAEIEYKKGNITDICYKAMMKYQIEITD